MYNFVNCRLRPPTCELKDPELYGFWLVTGRERENIYKYGQDTLFRFVAVTQS